MVTKVGQKTQDVIKDKSHQKKTTDNSTCEMLYMLGISEPQMNKTKNWEAMELI
jgi:hypothetical protein